jgi:serine/threonine protein kinase/tetratricopeptide (TPR) repeat protein
MDTDRNLLFGVLALHLDLVTGEQFARACMAWSARKHESLGAILVEQGLLTAEERADVERLLERKLQRNGGDVRASLAQAMGVRLVASLADLADDAVQRSLAALPAPGTARPGTETIDEVPGPGTRYTRIRIHASGGIGEVWLAQDAQLGRSVALKQLKSERAGEEAAQARLLNEARITGQLEHPGIVPVYELQRGEDGQPFYTMRFIKGRTLSEAVKAYHERRRAGKVSSLDLRELLQSFVAVCQIVAYAHSRQVLHRDLKGSNVVLGNYGEVVVLDWGLAKVIGGTTAPDAAGSVPPVDLSAGASREGTLQGQVLGTPAYMAPEQAEGRLDQLGPATDVYGLGAILYEILTGAPPFAGPDVREILRKVVSEDPLPPLKAVPGTPQALDAVCRKALAKEPTARYGSSAALARDVELYLADEPTSAYRESWTTRLARWERRHRRLVVSAVAVVLAAAVLVLTWSTVQLQRSSREEHDSLEMVQEQANRFLKEVGDDLLLNEPGMQPLRQSILLHVLDNYQKFLEKRPGNPQARKQMAVAKRQLGELYGQVGRMTEAGPLVEQAVKSYEALLREVPEDRDLRFGLAQARHALAGWQVQSGEPGEGKKEAERAIVILEGLKAEEPLNSSCLELLARSYDLRASATAHQGDPESGLADTQRVREILVAALHDADPDRPGDAPGGKITPWPGKGRDRWRCELMLARACANHGVLLYAAGRHVEAVQVLQEAITAYGLLLDLNPRSGQFRYGLALALLHFGRVQVELGRPGRAEAALREALTRMQHLARDDQFVPEYAATRRLAAGYLGEDLFRRGRTVAAAQLLREAEQQGEEAPAGPDKDSRLLTRHARLLHALGCLEGESGALAQGLDACHRADAKLKQAMHQTPGDRSLRSDWLENREVLARCGFQKGDITQDGWIAEQQAILTERRDLARRGPSSPRFQGGVAASAAVLAGLLLEAGRPVEALSCVEEMLPAHERLVRAGARAVGEALANGDVPPDPRQSRFLARVRPSVPEDLELPRLWAVLLARKGAALTRVGRAPEGVKAVRQAISITEGLLRGGRQVRCPPASVAVIWSFLAEELYWYEPCYLYDLAGHLALASTLPGDAGIADPGGQAIKALADYVATGFDNPYKLRNDPALEPLRNRDGFQKLIRDLEAKGQAGQKTSESVK